MLPKDSWFQVGKQFPTRQIFTFPGQIMVNSGQLTNSAIHIIRAFYFYLNMTKSKKIMISIGIVIVAAILATSLSGQYDSKKKSMPQRFIILVAAGAVIALWQIKKPVNKNNEGNGTTGK
jgi:hypothetical protein